MMVKIGLYTSIDTKNVKLVLTLCNVTCFLVGVNLQTTAFPV